MIYTKVKESSTHYKFLRRFYYTSEYYMPESTCKYIRMVIIGTLLLPVTIISYPFRKHIDKAAERIGVSFVLWFSLLVMFSMVAVFFTQEEVIHGLALAGWVCVSIFILALGVTKTVEYYDNKEPDPNAFNFWQSVKDYKHKICKPIKYIK